MEELPLCKKAYRAAPPVWVTVTGYDTKTDQKAKVNRNYLIGERKDIKQPFIVPKRSLVTLHPQSQALFENSPSKKISPQTLLGVRVLSIPPDSKKLHENASESVKKVTTYRDHLLGKKTNPEFAIPGSRGYLKYEDLEKVEEQKGYVFMLKKDSPLLKKISEDTGEADVALELAQEDGKYIVNHCCDNDGVCRDFAIYKALNPKTGEEIKTKISLESDCESCLASQGIAIQKDFMQPLKGLLDVLNKEQKISLSQFNFVDSRGFVQLPVSDLDLKTGHKQGPYGSIQYSPEKGNADIYLKPETACGFTQVLKTWQKKFCPNNSPDCRIEFGNASHAFYEKSTGNNKWPHNTHSNGECIDIRPNYKVAKDGGRKFNSKDFDKAKFKNFMDLAEQLGPDMCFTNRNDLNKEYKETANCLYDKNHDDHLHICFPRKHGDQPNQKLLDACLNGVK